MLKKEVAGRGALGSAKAHFFHPPKPIRDYLKHNYDKETLHNVLIVDKEEAWINKKAQMAYECRINEIDEANIHSLTKLRPHPLPLQPSIHHQRRISRQTKSFFVK